MGRRRWTGPPSGRASADVSHVWRRSLSRRPRFSVLAARSFRWVWSAAPIPFVCTLAAQLLGAAALAVVLLSGRELARELTADSVPTSLSDVLPAVISLGVALFVSGLCLIVDREARYVLSELVVHRLQQEIADIASSVDYERYEDQEFHDLLDRAANEGAQSSIQMVYDLLALVSSTLTSLSLVLVLATTVPVILPLLVAIGLPFVFAARVSARMAYRLDYELTASDRLRFSLYEALVSKAEAKEVRVFALHRPLRERWERLFADRARRMSAVALKRTMLNGAASLSSSALIAGLLLVIVDAAIDGRVAISDSAIAIVALQQIASRIRGSSASAGSLREASLFLEDFERFRSLRQEDAEVGSVERLPELEELRMDGVSFRYPGTSQMVLNGVDLTIGRHEIVALVGRSGSGKTTLAHLAAGLYRPTSGSITWNGADVTSVSRTSYWRSLAVVCQDYVQYELTAGENIAISDHERLDDRAGVVEAARRAGVDRVLSELPKGYDTMLSRSFDEGATLSQGEWQRLAVARALFRDAPLVILDEPSASLDAIAEKELFDRLVELCASRSVLLISHRFSTVRMADRIYVLQDGMVAEEGSHAELMACDGHYAEMFRIQAAGYAESP